MVKDDQKIKDQLIKELQNLRKDEDRHRSYFDNSPIAIFVYNAEGNYINANAAACRMLGYSIDELLGLSIIDIIPPKIRIQVFPNFVSLKKIGQLATEIVLQRKDGTQANASLTAVSIFPDHFMAFVEDITQDHFAVQEMLRQSEERLRTLFSSSVGLTYAAGSGTQDPFIKPVIAIPAGGQETILAVEDDETVRALSVRLLERLGYQVLSANSGDNALTLAGSYDLPSICYSPT